MLTLPSGLSEYLPMFVSRRPMLWPITLGKYQRVSRGKPQCASHILHLHRKGNALRQCRRCERCTEHAPELLIHALNCGFKRVAASSEVAQQRNATVTAALWLPQDRVGLARGGTALTCRNASPGRLNKPTDSPTGSLLITMRGTAWPTTAGSRATGMTVRLVPMTMKQSHASKSCCTVAQNASGSASPKNVIWGLTSPPQSHVGMTGPALPSPAPSGEQFEFILQQSRTMFILCNLPQSMQ